jgi:hypothetical protein
LCITVVELSIRPVIGCISGAPKSKTNVENTTSIALQSVPDSMSRAEPAAAAVIAPT